MNEAGATTKAMRDFAMRQPEPRRHAAETAYFALRCIAEGRPSQQTTAALADNVAKMRGAG